MAAKKEERQMVTAVFRDRADAQLVYDDLMSRGYTQKEINVLMSDATRATYYAGKPERISAGTHAAEGMAAGGAIGTAVVAGLAALAAIGTSIAIPGLGLIIAGPIVAALAGGGAGAVAGGVLGGLVGLGVPESNAKAYEEALRDGGVVIGVIPRSLEEGNQLIEMFGQHRGDNICRC